MTASRNSGLNLPHCLPACYCIAANDDNRYSMPLNCVKRLADGSKSLDGKEQGAVRVQRFNLRLLDIMARVGVE
jgi:hypothetical protein